LVSFSCTVAVELVEFATGCSNEKRRAKYLKPQTLFWTITDWSSLFINWMVIHALPEIAPFSPESMQWDQDHANNDNNDSNDMDHSTLVLYQQFKLLNQLEVSR